MNLSSHSTAVVLGCALAVVLTVTEVAAQQQPAQAASAAAAKKPPTAKKGPARPASAAPLNWNAQLVACKNEAGMNLVKREKCVYAHCKGHWGQGDCPPGQDMPTKDSFKNPFKRGS